MRGCMPKIKVSDYITQFLVDNGIKDLFLISGGGMMHLLDSAGKQSGLNLVFNLNEQASSVCADSYGQFTGNLGCCMVTTGPGATNAVTGCAASWLDSTPVLFISGQVKIADMGQIRGLRQFGAQEVAIVPMVAPITKYAVVVMKKETIRYHLEKAVYLAKHGRRGPVWIDVPLDIQGGIVEEADLIPFQLEKERLEVSPSIETEKIEKAFDLLNQSRRPVLLLGHGVVAANMPGAVHKLVETLNIPVLVTWRAKGIFGDDEELFMGSPGIPTVRYSNFILQNADFLIVIGTRLSTALTAYQERNFAPKAKKIIVDIDEAEINKLDMDFALTFVADAGKFITKLKEYIGLYQSVNRTEWLDYCSKVKKRYPLRLEKQPYDNEGKVDGFAFAEALSEYSRISDVYIGSSSGRTCGISHMAYKVKYGQKFVSSMGLGSMGWSIPSAIACCIASGKQRTLVMEGDGSLQHNIQELALINTYELPIKIFIWSNNGYASIYGMQRNNFKSRFVGCNRESGLRFPSVKAIADAYELPYYKIEHTDEISKVLAETMADDKALICELSGSINFDEIPKSMTIAHSDGTFESSKLDNLYPFLSEQEIKESRPD
ncbi:acetolactate synthase [Spirochaetia bacterium]|nr:acetolactate synthase [Spirochaetia bacterium]